MPSGIRHVGEQAGRSRACIACLATCVADRSPFEAYDGDEAVREPTGFSGRQIIHIGPIISARVVAAFTTRATCPHTFV